MVWRTGQRARLGHLRTCKCKDSRGAGESFEQFVRKRPEWIEAHTNLALRYWNTGNQEGACQSFEAVLRQDANPRDALRGRAAMAIEKEDFEQALDMQARLIEAASVHRSEPRGSRMTTSWEHAARLAIMIVTLADMRPSALHPLLLERYSTRTYLDKTVAPEALRTLFEAAQWAPSCFNEQPWRFAVAVKGTAEFDRIASTIVEGNAWALKAPVLGIAIANGSFERNGKPNRWGGYDTGQAMAHLTVQAQSLGLNVHQMGGFDAAKALEVLEVPVGHEALAAFAIGYAADPMPPANGSPRKDFDSLFFGKVPW